MGYYNKKDRKYYKTTIFEDLLILVFNIIVFIIKSIGKIIKYIYSYIKYKTSGYSAHNFKETIIDNDKQGKGNKGEYEIFSILNKIDDGKVLSNLYLYDANGKSTEIDILFIHPTGIYVIESKNMSGLITWNKKYNNWLQRVGKKSYPFNNPIHQNINHIEYIRNILDNQYNCEIFNFIVFGNNTILGNIDYDRKIARVLNVKDLDYVINRVIIKTNKTLTNEQVEYLYHKFEYSTKVSEDAKIKHIEDITGKENGVV